MAKTKLSEAHHRILESLERGEQPTAATIAGTSERPSLSRSIGALESARLIDSVVDHAGVRHELTPAGCAMLHASFVRFTAKPESVALCPVCSNDAHPGIGGYWTAQCNACGWWFKAEGGTLQDQHDADAERARRHEAEADRVIDAAFLPCDFSQSTKCGGARCILTEGHRGPHRVSK